MAEDQPPVSDSQPSDPNAEAAAGDDAALGNAASAAPDPLADALAADLNAAMDASGMDQAAIDNLLKQASFEDVAQATGGNAASASGGEPLPQAAATAMASAAAEELQLPNFQQVMQDAQVSSIDLLRDVELNVKIELGRAKMLVEDVLKLGEGSVVELDKLAGDPVDVFVNERLVARGEVLVLNDSFCVRINEIVSGAKDDEL